MRPLGWIVALWLMAAPALAVVEAPQFDDELTQTRYRALIEELRCPKCQNQNIADSNAPLAEDLRTRVADMLADGRSDQEIVNHLVERYGDFVTYRPPFRPLTWPLWLGPLTFVVIAGLLVLRWVRRRTAADPAALSPDEQARLDALTRKDTPTP